VLTKITKKNPFPFLIPQRFRVVTNKLKKYYALLQPNQKIVVHGTLPRQFFYLPKFRRCRRAKML